MEERTCRLCERTLPIEQFHIRSDTGHRRTDCRECCGARTRAWFAARPGKAAEHTRRWRANKPDQAAAARIRQRCTAYGITVERYEAMLAAQAGGCAMCGKTEQGRMLAIDHDHECCPEQMKSCGRCVRGLLCGPCNTAVGYFENEGLTDRCSAYVSGARGVVR